MATVGMFGIRRTNYKPGDCVCLTCYRSWREDITPASRCPWEYLHARDRRHDIAQRKRKAIIAGLWG